MWAKSGKAKISKAGAGAARLGDPEAALDWPLLMAIKPLATGRSSVILVLQEQEEFPWQRQWGCSAASRCVPGHGWSVPGHSWSVPGQGWYVPGQCWCVPGQGWCVSGHSWSVPGQVSSSPAHHLCFSWHSSSSTELLTGGCSHIRAPCRASRCLCPPTTPLPHRDVPSLDISAPSGAGNELQVWAGSQHLPGRKKHSGGIAVAFQQIQVF